MVERVSYGRTYVCEISLIRGCTPPEGHVSPPLAPSPVVLWLWLLLWVPGAPPCGPVVVRVGSRHFKFQFGFVFVPRLRLPHFALCA